MVGPFTLFHPALPQSGPDQVALSSPVCHGLAIVHHEYIASANMTPFCMKLCYFLLNHGVLLLQGTVNMCPAEFADIF